MVRQFASEIVGRMPSHVWSQRFCKRWSDDLDARYLTHIDAARHKADCWYSYNQYFEHIKRKMLEYDVQAHNIYNMDEKGFLIGFGSKTRRIFTKQALQKVSKFAALRDSNREWITILATICADGTWLPPALIYKAETGNIQDTWVQDLDVSEHQAHFTASPTG